MQWQYADDDGTWGDVCDHDALLAHDQATHGPTCSGDRYEYDLQRMLQVNTATSFIRPLRLLCAPEQVGSEQWVFVNDAGVECPSEPLSNAIAARRAHGKLCMDAFRVHLPSGSYQVSLSAPGFTTGAQENWRTGVRRAIRQVYHTAVAAVAPRVEYTPLGDVPGVATPHDLACPITQALMTQPMQTVDGHVYEHAAIRRWLRTHDTSPLTGLPLPSKELRLHVPTLVKLAHFRKAAAAGEEASA